MAQRKRIVSKPDIATPWPAGMLENHAGFSSIIEARFGWEAAESIQAAYEMSKGGHQNQTRKGGERYFNHPRSVAIILLVELENDDWQTIVEALLHDIREDTHLLRPWAIEKLFGVEVLKGLRLLTKIPKEGYLARLRHFGTTRTLTVKLADRLHNLRTLGSCSPEHRAKQIEESRRDFLPLCDLLIDRLPPEDKGRGEYLRRKIEHACDHWDAV